MADVARGGGAVEGAPRLGVCLTGGAELTIKEDRPLLSADAHACCR